jgi:hypothetical protein
LRPWLLMRELAIPFSEHLVPFSEVSSKDAFLAFAPNGKVPCLHDGGQAVWDSLAIIEHLAERHAESLFMIYLICPFERKGMQCKARRAAQGGPLSKRRNAAMRPFRSNPPGSPANRSLAALRLLAVAPLRRVAAPCIRPVCGAADISNRS